MLDREKSGQHVAVYKRQYCENHPNPWPETEHHDHSFTTMTFVTDEFAGDTPETGWDSCSCGGQLESDVTVLSWPPTPLTGEAVVSFLAKTDGLIAIETAAFGYDAVPADTAAWEAVLPIEPVPNLSECLQATVADGHLLTANSYTGDPIGLGPDAETAVDTLGVICRQLPTAPISMKNCELDSLLWDLHDGFDVTESVSAVADVSTIIDANSGGTPA